MVSIFNGSAFCDDNRAKRVEIVKLNIHAPFYIWRSIKSKHCPVRDNVCCHGGRHWFMTPRPCAVYGSGGGLCNARFIPCRIPFPLFRSPHYYIGTPRTRALAFCTRAFKYYYLNKQPLQQLQQQQRIWSCKQAQPQHHQQQWRQPIQQFHEIDDGTTPAVEHNPEDSYCRLPPGTSKLSPL